MVIVLTVLSSLLFACNDISGDVKKYETAVNDLENIMHPRRLLKQEPGKRYKLTDVIDKNDPIYLTLFTSGLISENTYLDYSSKDCISLVTRKKKNNMGTFLDHVITFNLNEGEFACDINHLYTLNQDENVNHLHFGAYQLSSLTNLLIVSNR